MFTIVKVEKQLLFSLYSIYFVETTLDNKISIKIANTEIRIFC